MGRQVRLDLVFPEPIAILKLNPLEWHTSIGHDELHPSGAQPPSNIIARQPSATGARYESVVPPQLAQREMRHDSGLGVHVSIIYLSQQLWATESYIARREWPPTRPWK
jgi:hypothetical protein